MRIPLPRLSIPKPWPLKVYVSPFEQIPYGYGVAYQHYITCRAVAFPIPLNILIRLLYLAWVWCMWPLRNTDWMQKRIYQKAKDFYKAGK